MKILAVTESKHLGNTKKIANALAHVAPVSVTDTEIASRIDLGEYDIVGFGSGIYFGKHDKRIINLVSELDDKKAYTFVFSTYGKGTPEKYNKPLIDLLESKNKVVLGSFGCLALDKFFIFALNGGINKELPNVKDFISAENFMLNVIGKYFELEGR